MRARSGITDYDSFVPSQALSRAAIADALGWIKPSIRGMARGARRYADWDEDVLTMSVGACRRIVAAAHEAPGQLCLASTTAPFLDRQNAGVIATALDLPETTRTFEFSGSQRAALSALISLSESTQSALLVSSDKRPTRSGSPLEMLAGDAAAAVYLDNRDVIAEIILTRSIQADFVDHYRTVGSRGDYTLEDRWFRDEGLLRIVPEVVKPLLADAGSGPSDISHFILAVPDPSMIRAVGKSLGIDAKNISDNLFGDCGHAGAAHPLLMLADVLDRARPGERILLCAFGQGCDAVLLRTTDRIWQKSERIPLADTLQRGRTHDNYMRLLVARDKLDMDWGMRAERDNRTAHSVAYTKSRDVYALVGGKCLTCGTPQFPKARRCVNPQCGALDTQTDYRFADLKAAVKTFTEDWLAFTRTPPLIYGNVSFNGGGNIFLEMTGFGPGEVEIGTPVRPEFRIKDIDKQRGFHRYFWKAAPYAGASGV
ncbi:MAG: 3-oxoacyl-ACP synthase [Hyphomonadaceae bacterium]|nr:3-oxoacyl-ACP synthase [Hyphomonadaceae bacterium]MBC6412160.1 3-oxoacyl-ACP synthase [Hyphomonadaceae bacterium]